MDATAPTIVPSGGTYTPKQLHFDAVGRKLYWGDRKECVSCVATWTAPMWRAWCRPDRVMRTVAMRRGGAWPSPSTMPAGICTGRRRGPSDAGLGKILRAGIEVLVGESAADRSDIEVVFKDLPEPIDLEIDHTTRTLYWTDRGDPPHGNTVNRAQLDALDGSEPDIVATHLMEGIGIALDPAHDRMFVTDLGGNVWVAALDGSGQRPIRAVQGNLTGIAYAELPSGSTR